MKQLNKQSVFVTLRFHGLLETIIKENFSNNNENKNDGTLYRDDHLKRKRTRKILPWFR